MSKTIRIRLITLCLGLTAIAGAYQYSAAAAMLSAADAFLKSLDGEQRSIATFPFDAKERTNFHYVPDNNFQQTYGYPRPGLTYLRMQAHQRHLADALLVSGLSPAGFAKAKTIQSLEDVLRIQEADLTGRREPLKYYFTIFGEPSATGTWGWRAEGHHLSLHFTLKGGKLVASSPTFFGTNPNTTMEGPRKGLAPLKREGDLGFELLGKLTAEQKTKAIVTEKAYNEMITAASTRAKLENQPAGLAASEMTAEQYNLLKEIIAEFANNVTGEAAAERVAAADSTDKAKLMFAWAGATEPGKGDYYRIQAPTFLIEYDNVQNDANHVHSIWRDYDGDFGRDVLSEHYKQFDHTVPVAAE
jgi:hypothetical protein